MGGSEAEREGVGGWGTASGKGHWGGDGGKYPHEEADMENTLDREPAVRERTELGIVACP